MAIMPLPQAMFLLLETRDQPMHVGSLQLFRPPEGSGPEFLREMYEDLISHDEMAPLFVRFRAFSGRPESRGDSHGRADLIHGAGWMEAGMDGQAVVDGSAVAGAGRG